MRLLLLCVLLRSLGSSARLLLGADFGTESVRAAVIDSEDGRVVAQAHSLYATSFPRNGFAEQWPGDWWTGMQLCCQSLDQTLKQQGISGLEAIEAVCVDTTACTVLLLDHQMKPLCPCLLWMDTRAVDQAMRIVQEGLGDEVLRVNNAGAGPVSAEWMLPKALWLKEERPELWRSAKVVCEAQDFINYKLTGRLVASGCNVAARWHWDAAAASAPRASRLAGRPVALLRRLGLLDLLDKWPERCVPMGRAVGTVGAEAATCLGLREGVVVAQGGPDAYVAMLGLGCCRPGQVAMVTGSSHLHLVLCPPSAQPSPGVWGPFKGAPLSSLSFAEGGQSSTGSGLAWLRRLVAPQLSYAQLDAMAAAVEPGTVLALSTFQGSRTPRTDPTLRGALVSLSLAHGVAELWRGLMEAVVMGSRRALDGLVRAELLEADEPLRICGGATASELWLKMHCDATNRSVLLVEHAKEAALVGNAVLAGALLELQESGEEEQDEEQLVAVQRLVGRMVRVVRTLQPQPVNASIYQQLLVRHEALEQKMAEMTGVPQPERGAVLQSGLVPSLLAADFAALGQDARLCLSMGASWVHLDVCSETSRLVSREARPLLSCFNAMTVAALQRCCPDLRLDVHVVAGRQPEALLDQFFAAGAHRVTLQLEELRGDWLRRAVRHAEELRARRPGFSMGLSLLPATHSATVLARLASLRQPDGSLPAVLEAINLLAVNPGEGGQTLQPRVLDSVRHLRAAMPSLPWLAVDGGIADAETARRCLEAGASVLVVGTGVFGRDGEAGEARRDQAVRRRFGDLLRCWSETTGATEVV